MNESGASPANRAEKNDGRQRVTASLRLLLVDDDAAFRESFRYVLRAVFSCDVTEAENAESAYETIRAGGEFDLIFIDIQMPDTDGIELHNGLRAAGVTTPVVLMSALPQNRGRVNALGAPFFDKALDGGALGEIIGTLGGSR